MEYFIFLFIIFIMVVLFFLFFDIFYKVKNKRLSNKTRRIKAYIVNIDKREKNEGFCYFLKAINENNTFIAYGNLSNSTYGSVLDITVNGLDKVLDMIEIPNEVVGVCEISKWNVIEKTSENSYILLNKKGKRISESIYGELFVVGDTIVKTKYLYEEDFSKTFYELKVDNTDYSVKVFNYELNLIKDKNLRDFVEFVLTKVPKLFWTMPASTTGKYHPDYAKGIGGLVRHTKGAIKIAESMSILE